MTSTQWAREEFGPACAKYLTGATEFYVITRNGGRTWDVESCDGYHSTHGDVRAAKAAALTASHDQGE